MTELIDLDFAPKFKYAVVVETNQYTGNYEREFCAYVTGSYGECEVGSEMAEVALEEAPELKLLCIDSRPDEHGCHRPVQICSYARRQDLSNTYHDLVIFFDVPPTKAQFDLIKERAHKYAELSRKNFAEDNAKRLENPHYYNFNPVEPRAGDLEIKNVVFIKRTTAVAVDTVIDITE